GALPPLRAAGGATRGATSRAGGPAPRIGEYRPGRPLTVRSNGLSSRGIQPPVRARLRRPYRSSMPHSSGADDPSLPPPRLMNLIFRRSIAWTLVPIVLAACRESAADAGWQGSVETLPTGAEHVRNPSVGMWGDHDGWSLIEEV